MRRPDTGPSGLLEALFRARSIAVVGASDRAGSVGRDVVENLQNKGFAGRIYPINPRRDELLGLPCRSSLSELPEPPDLVAVAVPAAAAPGVVREAGACGAGAAIVFASGFAETGGEGIRLQSELKAAAKASGLHLIGPNCQGFMNVGEGMHVGFGPPYRLDYTPGSVSIVSQSGAFGNSILMGMEREGVGTRFYISTGNESTTDALTLVEAMLEDAGTEVIAAYIEGLRSPHRLARVAARAREAGVPLVFWKVGRSEAGAKAAASHTASLAGNDRLLRSAFRQFGVVEAHDIGEMADCVRALRAGRSAAGPRLGIVTVSGGAGVAMADQASDCGLVLPDLAEKTAKELRRYLPEFASIANPLDVTAGATTDPAGFTRALEAVACDPGVDMLALSFAAISGVQAQAVADAVCALAGSHDVPIAISWNAPEEQNRAAFDLIRDAGIPIYASPARAVRGLAAVWQASRPLIINPVPMRPVALATQLLDEAASKAHLKDTGIDAPKEAVVHSREAAVAAAQRLGFPVVLKLLSSHLAHKSDIGGVRVGLSTPDGVAFAFDGVAAIPAALAEPLPFEGALVQEQIGEGVEVILGARRDPDFGPVVMVGAGGVLAELFDDVSLRLAPVTEAEADAMIGETRLARLLAGWRGAPACDRAALARAIAALSERVADVTGELEEIEINPLFVRPQGQGVVAGDCVAHVRRDDQQEAAAE